MNKAERIEDLQRMLEDQRSVSRESRGKLATAKKTATRASMKSDQWRRKFMASEEKLKVANERLTKLRKSAGVKIQQDLTATGEVPGEILSYILAANASNDISWVTVETKWYVKTLIAGVATEDKRYAVYKLEDEKLGHTRREIEHRITAEVWGGAPRNEYGDRRRDHSPNPEKFAAVL